MQAHQSQGGSDSWTDSLSLESPIHCLPPSCGLCGQQTSPSFLVELISITLSLARVCLPSPFCSVGPETRLRGKGGIEDLPVKASAPWQSPPVGAPGLRVCVCLSSRLVSFVNCDTLVS